MNKIKGKDSQCGRVAIFIMCYIHIMVMVIFHYGNKWFVIRLCENNTYFILRLALDVTF